MIAVAVGNSACIDIFVCRRADNQGRRCITGRGINPVTSVSLFPLIGESLHVISSHVGRQGKTLRLAGVIGHRLDKSFSVCIDIQAVKVPEEISQCLRLISIAVVHNAGIGCAVHGVVDGIFGSDSSVNEFFSAAGILVPLIAETVGDPSIYSDHEFDRSVIVISVVSNLPVICLRPIPVISENRESPFIFHNQAKTGSP